MTTDTDFVWLSMTGSAAETRAWAQDNDIPISKITHADEHTLQGHRMQGVAVHRSASFYARPDAADIEHAVNMNLIKSGMPVLTPFFEAE